MSLLQQIIRNLSPTEARRAGLWLDSPLHNRREDCRRLFQLRLDEAEQPTPEVEYAVVYGGDSFDPAKHRQLEHQLLKRLEAYLAWETYHRDPYATDEHLLNAYRDRDLQDLRNTRLRRYRPGTDAGYQRLRFEYQNACHRYELETAASRGRGINYRALENALERYIIALRLRQVSITLTHQRFHKTGDNFIPSYRDQLLIDAGRKEYKDDLYIQLFYLVARLQIDDVSESEPHFIRLTHQLTTHYQRIRDADRRDLLILAINHGLLTANKGSDDAVAATFTLYKFGLELDLLRHQGKISKYTFNNTLALAIRLKDIDYATNFVETYSNQLPVKGGNEVLALGRARLALATGKDGEALFHLQQADFKDFIHHLTARVMQLKIYFRQDSYTLLQSHISSTRKLLTRRKSVGYHLQNYRNIFQLANAVLRLGPGEDKARLQLQQRIAATEPCTERGWLLEVLEAKR